MSRLLVSMCSGLRHPIYHDVERQGYPATLGIAKTELSIFFRADCTMVTLRIVIFAHLHHAPHRFINRTTSNLRICDLANCLDESDNSRRALKPAVAVFVKDFT